MSDKILILGGTKEAARHAKTLIAEGHFVITSLAGRTKEPKPVEGQVRIGGFGGAEGLASYIQKNAISKVIDMTHPFAKQISQNAQTAAELTGVTLEVIQRQPWQKLPQDNWIAASNLKSAAKAIPQNSRVLLALGSQHLAPFHHREDVFFVIRMVDKPEKPLPFKNHKLVLGIPSANADDEAALLKTEKITHIVCRNSGGTGAYAKIEAARQLELPVIMIENA